MSNIQYGLISRCDADTLEKTIDLICQEFYLDESINTCEIGIFDGQTSRGIHEYIKSKKYGKGVLSGDHGYATVQYYNHNHTCIDNNKDKEVLKPFPECNLIIGNSNEVYNQLEDNSQHLIFFDGCHCFAHVVSDFFCYADKIKVGGFMAWHDTGKHIKEFKDFQHGDKSNPDAYISVRKALEKIGLFSGKYGAIKNVYSRDLQLKMEESNLTYEQIMDIYTKTGNIYYKSKHEEQQWQLIFDEADETDEAGGICVFKKLY